MKNSVSSVEMPVMARDSDNGGQLTSPTGAVVFDVRSFLGLSEQKSPTKRVMTVRTSGGIPVDGDFSTLQVSLSSVQEMIFF